MPAQTAARRAAEARLRRRALPRLTTVPKDPCPECGVELGRPRGTSRRLVVFTSDRGRFRWRCPDCHGEWTETASTQVGSTTRGSAPSADPQTSSNQTTLPAPSR